MRDKIMIFALLIGMNCPVYMVPEMEATCTGQQLINTGYAEDFTVSATIISVFSVLTWVGMCKLSKLHNVTVSKLRQNVDSAEIKYEVASTKLENDKAEWNDADEKFKEILKKHTDEYYADNAIYHNTTPNTDPKNILLAGTDKEAQNILLAGHEKFNAVGKECNAAYERLESAKLELCKAKQELKKNTSFLSFIANKLLTVITLH
jgi:hypothetical protein